MILTQEAIVYTIGCIARVAFPQKECKVVFGDVPMLVVDNLYAIRFLKPDDSSVNSLFCGNASYSSVKSFDDKVSIKAFFPSGNADLFSCEGNDVYVNFDMISVSFLMLSRFEETMTDRRDKNGRFCFCDSLCAKYELVEIPIVDEYALLLRRYLEGCFEGFTVERRTPRFVPTHDIDFLFRFPNFAKALRTIAGDFFRRKSPGAACRSMAAYMKSLRDYKCDPYAGAILDLFKVSVENKLGSCFYFKALAKNDADCTYNVLSPKVQACLKYFKSLGLDFGLHGSYASYDDKAVLGREKDRLESVCGDVSSGRQHFLRFDALKTPVVWQSVGIRDDYTLGFAEHEGFRCGTCHPYPLFDIENNRVLDVVEHPLVVMDTTLFQYREIGMEEAFASVCRLYDRCVSVEGDFVMLWHNTTMFGSLEDWYKNVYLRFVKTLVRYKF